MLVLRFLLFKEFLGRLRIFLNNQMNFPTRPLNPPRRLTTFSIKLVSSPARTMLFAKEVHDSSKEGRDSPEDVHEYFDEAYELLGEILEFSEEDS